MDYEIVIIFVGAVIAFLLVALFGFWVLRSKKENEEKVVYFREDDKSVKNHKLSFAKMEFMNKVAKEFEYLIFPLPSTGNHRMSISTKSEINDGALEKRSTEFECETFSELILKAGKWYNDNVGTLKEIPSIGENNRKHRRTGRKIGRPKGVKNKPKITTVEELKNLSKDSKKKKIGRPKGSKDKRPRKRRIYP